MRETLTAVAACLLVLTASSRSQAQVGVGYGNNYYGTGARPAVSPYLGLGSVNPSLNYFSNIRPQLEIRALVNRQRGEIQDLERRERKKGRDRREDPLSQEDFTLPRTGHRVYFSTYSHYYLPPAPRGR